MLIQEMLLWMSIFHPHLQKPINKNLILKTLKLFELKIILCKDEGLKNCKKKTYVRKFLPPANEVLGKVIFSQVSVFPQRGCVSHNAMGREVCIRVCSGEECVSLWVQGVYPLGRHPPDTHPPRANTSPGQTPLRTDTPLGRHSLTLPHRTDTPVKK